MFVSAWSPADGSALENSDAQSSACNTAQQTGGEICKDVLNWGVWVEAADHRGAEGGPHTKNAVPYLRSLVTECRLHPDDVTGDEMAGGASCTPLVRTAAGSAKTFKLSRLYVGSGQAILGWNPTIPRSKRAGEEYKAISDCSEGVPSVFFGDKRKILNDQGQD